VKQSDDYFVGSRVSEICQNAGRAATVVEIPFAVVAFDAFVRCLGEPIGHPDAAYFFRFSAYGERLLEHIESHPGYLLPEFRKNEAVSFIQGGLRDVCVSRRSSWGIPLPSAIPDSEGMVVYVWADALVNYLEKNNIDSRNMFQTMPTQCAGFKYLGYTPGQFPESDYIADNGLHFETQEWILSRGTSLPKDKVLSLSKDKPYAGLPCPLIIVYGISYENDIFGLVVIFF